MGGSVSAGADNDEMIDNLIDSNYVKTPLVEKVLRSVDRGFYFLPEFRYAAYRDLAWKQANLHLSAPCIYSEVLEHLRLEPGLHFLNIGSGTGYLSTLAGLILGTYGVNHGIEVHADVVEYAYEKLEQFKRTCNGVDVFEFCEPVFIVGNVFNLNHDRRYDRIYCGAACPQVYQEHIKKLMKIGGVLVLPCEDELLRIVRTAEDKWEATMVLPVSFSTLQFSDKTTSSAVSELSLPDAEPPGLQEICRSNIRTLIRSISEKEEPELTRKRKLKENPNDRRTFSGDNCVVIPVFEDPSDPSGIESAVTIRSSRLENFRPVTFERLIRNLARNYQSLNDNTFEDDRNDPNHESENEDSDVSLNSESNENETENETNNGKEITLSENESQEEKPSCSKREEKLVDAVVSDDHESRKLDKSDEAKDIKEIFGNSITEADHAITSKVANISRDLGTKTMSFRSRKYAVKIKKGRLLKSSKKLNAALKFDDGEESTSGSKPKKVIKREKLDSGISEESDDSKISVSNESPSSESTANEPMEIDSDDSDFDEDSSEESNVENETNDSSGSISLKYRMALEPKIKTLPLPNAMKLYLNYNREFCTPC